MQRERVCNNLILFVDYGMGGEISFIECEEQIITRIYNRLNYIS